MESHTTLPEGSYWLLIQNLWRTGFAAAGEGEDGGLSIGEWNSCPFADVAFFDQGFLRAWFFTDKSGALRKKRVKSLGVNELSAAFGKGESHGLEQEVVALAVFGPSGKMDAEGRAGSNVSPLDRNSLRWLLDQRFSARRAELQAILKYVAPRGEREAVLRFDWRAQVCSFELRSAMAPLKSPSSASVVPAHQRLATHGPALVHSYKEKHVPHAAVKEAAAVCEAIAARLMPHTERDQVRVCADFKLLGGDKVVLTWASLPAAADVFPNSDFPASMPHKELPEDASSEGGGNEGGSSHRYVTEPRDVDPHLLLPQPKRRPGAEAADPSPRSASATGSARPSAGGNCSLSARPASVGGGVGGSAASQRRVPGMGLMCSKYFVCRGCGRAELRSLALQPERDLQSAKAPEVLSGLLGGGDGGGGQPPSRVGSARSSASTTPRGGSAPRERAAMDELGARPTSATFSASARLNSPRLKVNAADGWHRAAMCFDCSERMRKEEEAAKEEEARRKADREERERERQALASKPGSPQRRSAGNISGAPVLEGSSRRLMAGESADDLGAEVSASAPSSPPAEAPALAEEVDEERVRSQQLAEQEILEAAAEYLRSNQPAPRWLRPYLGGAMLSGASRPATSP